MQLEKDNNIKVTRLANDSGYYNNVFKKTEKILSVILYILSETKDTKNNEMLSLTIKDKTLKAHEVSLETLTAQGHEESEAIAKFQHTIVSLDSTLRLARVANLIPEDLHTIVADQLDTVLRYVNHHYLAKQGISVGELLDDETSGSAKKPTKSAVSTTRPTNRQRRVNIPAGDISTDAYLVYSQMTDRAERIKTVLEAKPQATIKDIAEVITDVSEKTIQRELNSLIEKGQVTREGERRWSRYSASK
jgi:DNA-binding transcriptional ArsR family regulator